MLLPSLASYRRQNVRSSILDGCHAHGTGEQDHKGNLVVIASNRNKGDELVFIVMAYGRKMGIVAAKTIYDVSQGVEKGYVVSKIFSTEGVVAVLWSSCDLA